MIDKHKQVLRVFRFLRGVFVAHVIVGILLIFGLVLSPPFVIGTGQFDELVHGLETYNFKWWFVGFSACAWLLPILLVAIYRTAKAAGLEVRQVGAAVRQMLENKAIPVKVDIDEMIPVVFDEPLNVPVELTTKIDLDDDMDIEANVPINTELPIETEVGTKVLGLGMIKIPIRTKIPVNVVVPIKARIRIKATGIAIEVKEDARVDLPSFDVPLKCRIETKIDLLSNLGTADLLKFPR